jgi:hypothetical protein
MDAPADLLLVTLMTLPALVLKVRIQATLLLDSVALQR